VCKKTHRRLERSAAAAFLALLLSGPSLGATSVYHSPKDDGLPGSVVPTGGVQTLYLYLDGGPSASAPGSACDVGNGDEVCGFDLEITGLNGLTLSSFTADPGADLLVNFSPAALRLNGLDSQSPTPGPQRIGALSVDAVVGGAVELTSGEVVGADLASEVLVAQTLATVPEPGSLLLLTSGIGLLRLFARRRARP